MTVTHLSPSKTSQKRLNLLNLLGLLDIGGAALIGVVFGVLNTAARTHTAIIGIWLITALAAWALTSPKRPLVVLDLYSRSITAPLLTLMLSGTILILANFPTSRTYLLLSTFSWAAALLLTRVILRRHTPAVVIGVQSGAKRPRTKGAPIQFVAIQDPQTASLHDIDAILLDSTQPTTPEWMELLLHAQAAGIPTWNPATLDEEISGRVSVEYLHQARLENVQFGASYLAWKRFFDVAAVLLALPLLLPLLALVALTVLIDTGRPILFWQERIGKDSRPFRMVKFRTMRPDAEQHGAAFASNHDARITRIGRLLRKFRLDELPQFWNVLRGDMSIIGPRPEQCAFVEQFNYEVRLYPIRHWVRPGITGWAQVTHGYTGSTDETVEKLRYDVYYIKHLSFWLDFRIVLKTIQTMLTGFGAR